MDTCDEGGTLDNLELFWSSFLKCENEKIKQTYLELFLYEFYKADKEILGREKSSLLSSIASQLSCHILQMIYQTICASISSTKEDDDKTTPTHHQQGVVIAEGGDADAPVTPTTKKTFAENNVGNEHKLFCKRILLKKASEWNHIISLREFLLSGTGGRILETLQFIGVSSITCGRELTNLLINLFPSDSWHDENITNGATNLPPKSKISLHKLIDTLIIFDPRKPTPCPVRQNSALNHDDAHKSFSPPTVHDEYDVLNDNESDYGVEEEDLDEYKTEDFLRHVERKMPSMEFSKILIHLMMGSMEAENLSIIDESSVTVQCLRFGLKYMRILSGEGQDIFERRIDNTVIMEKLLALVLFCLNNIFASKKNVSELIDVWDVLTQLVVILRQELDLECLGTAGNLKGDIIFGLYYYSFVLINNTYLTQADDLVNNFNEDMEKLQNWTPQIFTIFSKGSNSHVIFKWVTKLFIKIISNVKVVEYGKLVERSRKMNRKLMKNQQLRHHHKVKLNLKCTVENNLFVLLKHLSHDSVKKVLKFFQKSNTFCCCNLSVDLLTTLCIIAKKHPKSLHFVLNFLKNNYIYLILNTSCDRCSSKINSKLFQDELTRHYIEAIDASTVYNISMILDHIGKLPKTLPTLLARKVIFDIGVPVFENFKLKIVISTTEDDEDDLKLSKTVVYSCLNIFANYLIDFDLITEFFTEANIQHLDDLMIHYEIVPNIYRLIKIGLYNFEENNPKYLSIHHKIVKMPIGTTIIVTNKLLELFNRLNQINVGFNFKPTQQIEDDGDYDEKSKEESSELNMQHKTATYPLLFELRLAAVYWNMTLQLLQTNVQFKNEFKETFKRKHDDSTLITLIYNTLKCILHTNQINTSMKTSNYTTASSTNFSIISASSVHDSDQIDCSYNIHTYTDDNINYNKPKSTLILCHDEPITYEPEFDQQLKYNQFFESHFGLDDVPKRIYNVNDRRYVAQDPLVHMRNCYRPLTEEVIHDASQEVQEEHSIFDRFVNWMYGGATSNGGGNVSMESDKLDEATIEQLTVLRSAECRKILFQLFEIMLSAYFLDLPGNVFEAKMSPALEDLKTLVLCHSLEFWDSIENGTAILSALQSLLKVSKCKSGGDAINLSSLLQDEMDVMLQEGANEFWTPAQSVTTELSTDLDFSEDNGTEATFVTADDGYDADAENYNISETDSHISDLVRAAIFPASSYRNCVIHSGICKIIIEILFELCNRCIEKSSFWPGLLLQILTGLSFIRDSLGGSVFLLTGFRKILETNDTKLSDLQRSILELVTEVNTPECLSAYLTLFTSENPPVDLLLPRLYYLTSTFAMKVQSSIEVQFPCFGNSVLHSDADAVIVKNFKFVFDSHIAQNSMSPITKTKLAIPLDFLDFRPWTSSGFTMTAWLKLAEKSQVDEDHSTRDHIHVMSLGNKKLLFSIFIDQSDGSSIYLHLTCPERDSRESKSRVQSPERPVVDVQQPRNPPSTSDGKNCRRLKTVAASSLEGLNQLLDTSGDCIVNCSPHDAAPTTSTPVHPDENLKVMSNTYRAIKTTKSILRSSLSSFNIFSKAKSGKSQSHGIDAIKPIQLQNIKLQKGKWSHLCVSVETADSGLVVKVTMDGTEEELVKIHCARSLFGNMKKMKNLVMLGENRDEFSECKVKYSISNLMVFKEALRETSQIATLVGMGPDVVNFSSALTGNLIPNPSFLNNIAISTAFDFNTVESIKVLRKLLIGIYSAHEPNRFLAYDYEKSDRGQLLKMITIGDPLRTIYTPTIQTASILCGGYSVVMFLFARIVELTADEFLQSTALSLFLQTVYNNSELYSEFLKAKGIAMIGSVIRTKSCVTGLHLLKSIADTACDGVVMINKPTCDEFQIVTNTTACVVHADLLISVIIRYWDWYDPEAVNSDIVDVLFSLLLALVREKHPNHAINISRLYSAGIIPALLNFCKIYLVGASRSVYISTIAAMNLVSLVQIFAGTPPPTSLLDEILKLLVLMHRPSDSFVTHDRSRFYFLISPTTPVKAKRLSLPLTTPRLSQSIRPRKSTMPSMRSSTVTKVRRSMSFDVRSTHDNNWMEVVDVTGNSTTAEFSADDSITEAQTEETFDASHNESNQFVLKTSKVGTFTDDMLTKYLKTWKRYTGKDKKSKNIVNQKRKFATTPNRNKSRDRRPNMNCTAPAELDIDIATTPKTPTVMDTSDMFQAYNNPGFIKVQECFFQLLRDFIVILPDASVQEVLNHYITLDILIVLSNHRDVKVRTAIVNLLSAICKRLPAPVIAQHTKQNYWYHLGNQIGLNGADDALFNACVKWSTGLKLGIDNVVALKEINIRQKHGLNVLIAILPQTIMSGELTERAFHFANQLYTKATNVTSYLIENGLIFCTIKALAKIYFHNPTETNAVEAIEELLKNITYKSFTSIGSMNILWDTLNGLAFMEEMKRETIIPGVRSTQSKILYNIIESCQMANTNETSILNFKIKTTKMTIPGSPLSSSELKTRFDLVLDRAVQFFTNVDMRYQPVEIELKLIYTIVDLVIARGHTRGSGIILWSFYPTRPTCLKVSIIKSLAKLKDWNKLNCDWRVIKPMLISFMRTNSEHISESNMKLFTDFINQLDVPLSSTSNLSDVMNRLEDARLSNVKEHKPAMDRTIYKMESTALSCIESAMKLTRNVVELQNMERRLLLNHMRTDDDKETILQWDQIIHNMTHENGPWYSPARYPISWKLDHTEGPNRIRNRFKRCHPDIKPKFFLTDVREDVCKEKNTMSNPMLQYLMSALRQSCNFCANEQVIYNFIVKHIPVDNEVDGELIVTESQIIFMPSCQSIKPVLHDIIAITEIWPRRYQHQDVGMEFFLETGTTIFIIFANKSDRDTLAKFFGDKIVPDSGKLAIITQQWREAQLTNWEYLVMLNQMAGRTYHDLMQYPVFPWILSNYESAVLDLTNSHSFRALERPIAIQHKENEEHYKNNYTYLTQSLAGSSIVTYMKPYHYGSHYSNSGTILHFLVRVLPYTKLFLQYQDNNFDIPDRTFHALNTTWKLASKDSPTDVKELIPEFFTLPEMFENSEGFNFGIRQSGELVNNVKLPPWCQNSARMFVFIHRQALESDYVRQNLNHWIDLVFGYKQTGQHAVDAINVFHPATYYGFTYDNMEDMVEKRACETMIRTYGQMPKQLLTTPHATTSVSTMNLNQPRVLSSVVGIQWGVYTGSLQLDAPTRCNVQTIEKNVTQFVSMENTNVIYCIPERCNLMQGIEYDTMNMISWDDLDDVIRIRPVCDDYVEPNILLHKSRIDPITACGTNINSNQLWLGHKSGRISVYHCTGPSSNKMNKSRSFQHTSVSKMSYNSAFRKVSGKLLSRPNELPAVTMSSSSSNYQSVAKWYGPVSLIRHMDEIRQIKLSMEFKIAVSVGRDGIAVIWDINKIQYINTIQSPSTLLIPEIYLIDISPTLGDIITIHDTTITSRSTDDDVDEGESFEVTESNIDDFVQVSMNLGGNCMMRLNTINGKYVNHVLLQEKILCVCYTSIKEGTGVNAIVTGMEMGIVKFWSSWDLNIIREIVVGPSDVTRIIFSTYQHLVLLTKDDVIQVWESLGLFGISPKLYSLKEISQK